MMGDGGRQVHQAPPATTLQAEADRFRRDVGRLTGEQIRDLARRVRANPDELSPAAASTS